MNFKKFLALFQKEPPPKPEMPIDQEQAQFERDLMHRKLKSLGFNVGTKDWNVVHGDIGGRFSWGAFIGGMQQEHGLWDLRFVDEEEKVQQEVQEMNKLQPETLISALETLRRYAKEQDKK